MIPALVSQIGVPVAAQIISDSLGRISHPAAQSAAKALGQLDQALLNGQIDPKQLEEANRHAEKIAQIRAEKIKENFSDINKNFRNELASQDKYVRRMRPTFGYIMALTWGAQMFGLAYVIVFSTSNAHLVIQAIESLSMIWASGLSVLGIYVYKRSEEKKAASNLAGLIRFATSGNEPTKTPATPSSQKDSAITKEQYNP